MRFFVSLSYNGKSFCGWQIQENAISVQETVENAFSIILGGKISLTGAGRTDTGVNAACYFAHFDTDCEIKEPESLLYKINAILPVDVAVFNLYRVADSAHARFDATSRKYVYRLHNVKDPFATFSYFYKFPLNIEAMNRGAGYLTGTHDFSSFEKIGGGNKTSICTISKAIWSSDDNHHFKFEITADRFLRNMVRAIVGTLLEVGRGRQTPDWVESVMNKKDRCAAGQSVPGEALFLQDITYPYKLIPYTTDNKK